MAPKKGTTKKTPTRDSVRVAAAKKATQEFDDFLAKFARLSSSENATEIEKLTHFHEKIEKRIGGKAYVIYPDKPLPSELVDRVLREQPKQISASEALYAFTGWLTTRDRAIMMSAHHNVGAVAEIVAVFLKMQGIPAPGNNWSHTFLSMADVATSITNDPALSLNQGATPSPTFDQAYQQIVGYLTYFNAKRQNHLLARLLEELREGRAAELHVLTSNIEQQTERHTQLADASKELDQVLSGNFTIVHV